MFKITEIRELILLLDETSVSEVVVESAGAKLSIKKPEVSAAYQAIPATPAVVQDRPTAAVSAVQAVPQAAVPSPVEAAPVLKEKAPTAEPKSAAGLDDESLVKIISPMVGTFYSASSPDAQAYVRVGDKVSEKTVVCIVEAMKLMNEIEADVSGEIVAVLVENGQLVEYGQPMFLVKPE